MHYVGVDLHKKSISLCVIIQEGSKRKVIKRRNIACQSVDKIREFFGQLDHFQVVVEATSSYEWFVELVEPMADRVLLAHPKKLRVIAESTRKTDKLDAQVLAEFLALDMIPESWRPTPRIREHRRLVRIRQYIQKRITSVKNKTRHVVASYNADITWLFTEKGRAYLAELKLSEADRFAVDMLLSELDQHGERLNEANKQLQAFGRQASVAEREARSVLDSIPCVGPVTIDAVLAEVGDIRRFSSQRKATAYAGLAPGIRESAGRGHQLGITKEGSRLLRWTLVETAWRMVGKLRRWGFLYERLKQRCGAKKAIVAIARRIWCMMVSMLKSGQKYHMAGEHLARS